MKKAVVLTVVLTMAMAGFAWAGTDKGYKEIGINGALSRITMSSSDDVINNLYMGVVFNYFFSAYFSIGATYRVNLTSTEMEDGETLNTTFQTLGLRAGLLGGSPTKTVIPYIGLHGGNTYIYIEYADDSGDSSSFSYGAHGGLKIFPSERVSLNLELDYTTSEPDTDSNGTVTLDILSLFVGASFYF